MRPRGYRGLHPVRRRAATARARYVPGSPLLEPCAPGSESVMFDIDADNGAATDAQRECSTRLRSPAHLVGRLPPTAAADVVTVLSRRALTLQQAEHLVA